MTKQYSEMLNIHDSFLKLQVFQYCVCHTLSFSFPLNYQKLEVGLLLVLDLQKCRLW